MSDARLPRNVTRLSSSGGNYTAYFVEVRRAHAEGCAVFDGLMDYCDCLPGRWSPGKGHAVGCEKGKPKACDCGLAERGDSPATVAEREAASALHEEDETDV